VTYGTANDFFFSGHTAVAVLGAIEVARLGPWWLGALAGVIAFLEAAIVIILRAHYTIDVFGAAVAAWCAANLGNWISSLL
jgi:membrane-associated phospholipid phosphatase